MYDFIMVTIIIIEAIVVCTLIVRYEKQICRYFDGLSAQSSTKQIDKIPQEQVDAVLRLMREWHPLASKAVRENKSHAMYYARHIIHTAKNGG